MFLKRGKRPSVVSGFQRARYCRQASKPTTKDINDCCVLDLCKFPCVFQIIQYYFCALTHVFTSSLALSLPFPLMDTFRERLAQNCRRRTIWIADAHRGDGKRFIVHADELLTAFLELEL
jgi:hypothetical protein